MTATIASPTAVSSKALAERSHRLRNRLYGAAFILIALAIYWLFAQGVDAKSVSTYGLNQGNVAAADRLPDWVIPSFGTTTLLAVAAAAVGAYQLARGFGRATSVMLGLVAVFFVFAFLTWSTRPVHQPGRDAQDDGGTGGAAGAGGAVGHPVRARRRGEHSH